jgi:hypothetical protein
MTYVYQSVNRVTILSKVGWLVAKEVDWEVREKVRKALWDSPQPLNFTMVSLNVLKREIFRELHKQLFYLTLCPRIDHEVWQAASQAPHDLRSSPSQG